MPIVPKPSDLLGQEHLVAHFASQIEAGELPHAILLTGEEGGEAFPLSLVLAQQILCEELTPEGHPCGKCQSCRQMAELQHPDLTLVFPVIKAQEGKEFTSEMMLEPFRELIGKYRRFTTLEWREQLDAGNKQPQIMVAEAERLIHNTSLRSFKSQYQVILIWQPETMRTETANKLLKLLEEPPKGVVFIMVSHSPHRLLPTIISRLQKVAVLKIPDPILIEYLVQKESATEEEATELTHLAQGNLYKALQLKEGNGLFKGEMEALQFLQLPLQRHPKPLLAAAQEYAKMDRPEVIALLDSLPKLLRELLALQYGSDDVIFLPSKILDEAKAVSLALPLDKYPRVMEEVTDAKLEVIQNGNITMVLFDLLLTLTRIYSK